MYLCMDDMRAVRSLVDTLRIPSLDSRVSVSALRLRFVCSRLDLQEVILDTFFEVLNIKTPEWYNTFLEGRRLTSLVESGFYLFPPTDLAFRL
jgi:large subunit ribosomal protein L17e